MKQNEKPKSTPPTPTVTKIPLTVEDSSGGSKIRTILKDIQL